MKKSIVAASIALALGVSTSASAGFFAADSTYTVTVTSGCFAFGVDCAGAAQNIPGGSFTLQTDATGDAFTVGSYSVAAYTATPGGLFQTGGPVAGSGSVSGGAIDLNFAGRTGNAQFFPFLGTPEWNREDATGNYAGFTSGSDSAANPGGGTFLTITGSDLTLVSSSAGVSVWDGIIVSSANIGAAWGSFGGTPYTEIFRISVQGPSVSAVPVPAAAWLFGTGLIGLVGVARRRKSA